MDMRRLHHFATVARTGNFTRAAELLYIAQPAISKSIQKLEEELQMQLFDRADKHVSLTPEGRVLLGHAESILERLDEARHEMQELRGLQRGEILLGLPSMFGSVYFPPIIKAFIKQHPALRLHVIEEGTVQIRQWITDKTIDLGIISYDPDVEAVHSNPELMIEHLLTDEFVACFPQGHPLSTRSSISVQELLLEPLVLFKEGYNQRRLLDEASQQYGIQPNIVFTTNQLSFIRSLVVEGVGATLLLRTAAAMEPRLAIVPIQPGISVHLAVAHRHNRYLSLANRAFLTFLKEQLVKLKYDHLPYRPS
ncbi:LysR family transcriptional regulator [Paenibacillus sp. WLX1005]|uniref:LysR family transcriptional regulator n=1 Tax=Paenibacillus sp. WLX1005 TaxID=3243766 RepID=UPI00398400F3